MSNREVLVYSVVGAVGLTAAAAGLCLVTRKAYSICKVSGKHCCGLHIAQVFYGILTANMRCVCSLFVLQKSSSNPYEEKKVVDEYMTFHYCPPDEYMCYKFGPVDACDFPKRCAELCLKHKPVKSNSISYGTSASSLGSLL